MGTIINFSEQTSEFVMDRYLKLIQSSCADMFEVPIDDVITDSMGSVNGEETLIITIIDSESASIMYLINCILVCIEDGKALFEIYFMTEDDFEEMRKKTETGEKIEQMNYRQKLVIAINESNHYTLQSELLDKEEMLMALYGEIGCDPHEIAGIKIIENADESFHIGIHVKYIPILEYVFGYLTKKWNCNNI